MIQLKNKTQIELMKEAGRITGEALLLAGEAVKEGICDKCGQALYQRDDDTKEGIKRRLEVYHTQVVPLIDFYDKRNLLANVNALQDIEKVSQDINRILGGVK